MTRSETGTTLIVGGGIMGAGIAAIFTAAGQPVQVVSPSAVTRESLATRVASAAGQIGSDTPAGRLRACASLAEADWDEISLVIEAATEDLPLKQALFSDIETCARPDALLTSNTSTLPITGIGARMRSRDRLAGLHFFMPAHLVPLVEVVSTGETDEACAMALIARMSALGKVPIHVRRDIPGFVGNRIQHAMMREALALLDSGVASAEDIDLAVRYGFGFRFLACGPMLQKEMSGWDTNLRASTALYPELDRADGPPAVIREMVAQGDTGMKSGRGIWQWPAGSADRVRARIERTLRAALGLLREAGDPLDARATPPEPPPSGPN